MTEPDGAPVTEPDGAPVTEPVTGPVTGPVGGPLTEPDGGWRRVHPISPLLRSWQVLVVLLFGLVNTVGDRVLRGDAPDPRSADLGSVDLVWVLLLLGLVAAALVSVVAYCWVSYRYTRYRIDGDSFELYSGVLFRQHRRARLDRLQTVDVTQPLLARFAGLARLTVEVAGGSDSKIALSYLAESDAGRLRAELLARAAGLRFDGPEAPEAPERPLLEVPVGRLVASLLLSAGTALVALVVVDLTVVLVTGSITLVAFTIPAALGAAGVVWGSFSRGFNFRVAVSPDGLRLRHGLLEQRSQTVPPGRVQAIRIRQPIWWRFAGWWRVEVNIAGYSGDSGEDAGQEQSLLPVGTEADVLTLLALLLPDLGVEADERPEQVVRSGLVGKTGGGAGFIEAPVRASWLDPVGRRREGVRVTGAALLLRSGVLRRRLDLVPHDKIQSLGLAQGPLQRRLDLAGFAVHSTPGPVAPGVRHLDAGVAARLLADQAARSYAARSRTARRAERWMEQAAPDDDPGQGLTEG